MATAYTSLLGLALPVTGELSGAWGDVVNDSITSLLDSAISGTTSLTTDADVTLTTTTGAANQARQAVILWNPASGTTTRNITAPAQSKIYTVINASGGTQSIVFRGVGPTTGVTIVKGESAVVAWNGTDFIKIGNIGGGGVFTTLSVSGNLTLSGGTANGVAYLNGSKVLTTGSALAFTGSNFLVGAADNTVSRIQLRQATDSILGGYFAASANNDQSLFISMLNSGGATFAISGSEQMRLTSTGLGIGTSSPNAKLRIQNDNSTVPSLIIRDGGTPAANMIEVSSNATGNALILNASGNLGLGITPSAWGSAWKAFDESAVGSLAASPSGAGDLSLTFNAYNDNTNWRYKYTGDPATRYRQTGGAHAFFTAPSGTAGNAISFTQAMTLDASGRLGVGTTSPVANLDVRGTNPYLQLGVVGTSNGIQLQWDNASGLARLNTSGAAWPIVFLQNDTERARIDSVGRLLVKNTSSLMATTWGSISLGDGATLSGPATGSDFNALLAANAYFDGQWKRIGTSAASLLEMLFGGTRVQFFTTGSSTPNSTITWSDGPYIANGGNTWTNGSDEKLKNITGEIEDAVAKVMQIRAARYTWKKDPDNKPQVGLIAQDLQKVLPEVVVEPPEPTDRYGNETYLGVNYDHVIPLLVAAIKELKTEFDAYKASHP